jgi:E3 ubiquitin-protein ligase AIP2
MMNEETESLQVLVAKHLKELSKKQTFEAAAGALTGLVQERYTTATPAEQNAIYGAVCRAATLLSTRFTGTSFWMAGLLLFESAAAVVSRPEEKRKINGYVKQANDFLGERSETDETVPPNMRAGPSTSSYLYEGQYPVGVPEPEPPMAQQYRSLLREQAAHIAASLGGQDRTVEQLTEDLQNIMETVNARLTGESNRLDEEFRAQEDAILASLQEIGSFPRGPPPASKEEVAKLPIVEVSTEFLQRVGKDTECAVCREDLVLGDKLQEMPCKHIFHPPCLKPWLDEHNSCPVCRHELPTDDQDYERQKERDREAEEERKGAANAVRGGEFMYI